ncbi:MAG: hypothetical protein V1763_03185 [Parcubacteria group bacterium]
MKTSFLIIIALFFSLTASAVSATVPLTGVSIKYVKSGWNVYDFRAQTNLLAADLKYLWTVDRRETFNTSQLQYFFPKGKHSVSVAVQDRFGNLKSDSVVVNAAFWSLQDNWLLWVLYLVALLIAVYYWLLRIIYFLERQRLHRHMRLFLGFLDEHGWMKNLVDRLAK